MLFPTRGRKSRISSKLSYPVGAQEVSTALAGAPQAESIEISFHSKYETMETRGKPYSIFTISYDAASSSWALNPGWSITVRPVPRALKHTVKEALINEFFPRIRQWLEKNGDLTYGFLSLSVILDESSETLLKLE